MAQVAQVELIDLGRDLHDRPELIHDAVHPDTTGAVLMAREAAACVTGLRGGTRLLPVYSPGAVLQRYRPIRIAGTADNGTNVTVSLGGDRATATAGIDGTWTATLPARPEATGLTLTVAAPTPPSPSPT